MTPKLLEILNCLSRFSLTSLHFSYILETPSPLPWMSHQLTRTFAYVFSTGNVLASLWHIWLLPSKILLSATFLSKASLITPRRESSSLYLPDFFTTLDCCPISLSRSKARWGEDSRLLLHHHYHCHCHYWEQHYAKCIVSFNNIEVQFYKGANNGLE